MKLPKPRIYKAKEYNFWMSKIVFGGITLYSSGPTPEAAYNNLLTKPSATNNLGGRMWCA